MAAIRVPVPRSIESATATAEMVAHLDGRIAAISAQRDASIASVNAGTDAALAPLIEERDACATAMQAWWTKTGHQLLTGRRKTVELGGCIIGSKAASVSLTFSPGDDKLAAKMLVESRWSARYTKVAVTVDKPAVKSALAGRHGAKLRALGFGTTEASDVFVLDAVKQAGTIA